MNVANELRGKLPDGGLFLAYLILFSTLRFFIFVVRGSVKPVAFGLKNAQLTAIAILAVAVPLLLITLLSNQRNRHSIPETFWQVSETRKGNDDASTN